MYVEKIYGRIGTLKQKHPLFSVPVPAGGPSAADDFIEGWINLDEYLLKHPAETFYVRVTGDSMMDVGIHPGDLLIVDRRVDLVEGKIVIAYIDGEFTVKRLATRRRKLYLVSENEKYEPREVKKFQDFEVWGIVTHVIHEF